MLKDIISADPASGHLRRSDFPSPSSRIGDILFFDRGDSSKYCLIPGLADVHVHLREPGFSYKETIRSGTAAAARGGYTAVCSMPNLSPVPDCTEALAVQTDIIRSDALIDVFPYGSITRGEAGEQLSDMPALAPSVCAFSDDGHGVQSDDVMRQAMELSASLDKMIAAHCEDNSLLNGGYIHSGKYASEHGHRGISSESEWRQLGRDLDLVAKTGCRYHMCHVSTKESVSLIREAKRGGLDVTCETAPHYLLLDESCLREDGRFKMNPPLRAREDREALLDGICDGTVDMIATDHAPHSAEEKSLGLSGSAFGITGLECSFDALYTYLVLKGAVSLGKLIDLMSLAPRRRFRLPVRENDFTVFLLGEQRAIDSGKFASAGKSTPFDGWTVSSRCILTVCGGRTVWFDEIESI
ncbi:MAG: dihydroorotase [Oscillospiraceae bacterium]|nr:dihydroorotase [Oscillospiraceae bacterium]